MKTLGPFYEAKFTEEYVAKFSPPADRRIAARTARNGTVNVRFLREDGSLSAQNHYFSPAFVEVSTVEHRA